jgi:hypothetical protein
MGQKRDARRSQEAADGPHAEAVLGKKSRKGCCQKADMHCVPGGEGIVSLAGLWDAVVTAATRCHAPIRPLLSKGFLEKMR